MEDVLDVGVTAPFLAHLVGLLGYYTQIRQWSCAMQFEGAESS